MFCLITRSERGPFSLYHDGMLQTQRLRESTENLYRVFQRYALRSASIHVLVAMCRSRDNASVIRR